MSYPIAERVTPTNAKSAVACVHCKSPIAVSTWDKYNGFLVECPSCHGFHGRRWNIRGLVFASFLLNALSFFFTMRPGKALAVIAVWVAAFWLIMPRTEGWPEWAEALAFGALMLGPVIINAVLLVRHQIDLDRHPIAARAT
jgi:hypothetical protein